MTSIDTAAETGSISHSNGQTCRDAGFVALIIVFLINAVVTIVHFLSMFAGRMETLNALDVVLKIAIPDIAIAAVPSFPAAWALWRMRRWGVWLALVVAGAYFHGQIQLLVMAFQGDLGVTMAAISVYFIGFSGFFSIYLWHRKERFV